MVKGNWQLFVTMDEFESRFVDALSHPEVVEGIKKIIEPLLNQHLDTLTNIMQQIIDPLKSGLRKRKRRHVTQRGDTGVYYQDEIQNPDRCFDEVILPSADKSCQLFYGKQQYKSTIF